MSTALPITRSTRQVTLTASAAQVLFTFNAGPVWDTADLVVQRKVAPATRFTTITTGFTLALLSGGAGGATATFAVAPRPTSGDPAVEIRITSRRVHERETDVSRSGRLHTPSMEKEFDKGTTTLQELRRDIDQNDAEVKAEITETDASLRAALAEAILGTFPTNIIPNSLLANMAEARVKLRPAGAGTGSPVDGTPKQLRELFGIFDTIAELNAAKVDASITTVRVLGYWAAGDGGGHWLKEVTESGTLLAGQHRSNGATRRWQYAPEGYVNVRALGAKGNLAQDDAPYIQRAVDFAAGRTIYAPVGQYAMYSAVTSLSGVPINLIGDGTGAGSGSALQSNDYCTQFILFFANPSFIRYVGTVPCTFRGFQINVWPTYRTPGRGGTGISLEAPAASTATLANCVIDDVAFNWLGRCVYLFKPGWHVIKNCYFADWSSDAIYAETENDVEGSAGHIENNYFFGLPDGSQGNCIHLKIGYTIIKNNEILGAQTGVRLAIANFNAGYVRILDNTIEEQSLLGIYIPEAAGTHTLDFLLISRNEFAALYATPTAAIYIPGASRTWLGKARIYDNETFYGGGGSNHFWIASGANLHFSRNRARNFGATAHVAFLFNDTATAGLLEASIEDNDVAQTFTGSVWGGLPATSICRIRDNNPTALADLPAYAANGSLMMTTDAKVTNWAGLNFTAIGGGPGGHVERVGGAWLARYP